MNFGEKTHPIGDRLHDKSLQRKAINRCILRVEHFQIIMKNQGIPSLCRQSHSDASCSTAIGLKFCGFQNYITLLDLNSL